MATSVPKPQWTQTGFVIPQTADILTGVQADINAAFGGNLNMDLTTPQGQLASSETAVLDNANQTFLYYTQQVDPAYASGRMQDAIARIYFISREIPPSPQRCRQHALDLPERLFQLGLWRSRRMATNMFAPKPEQSP